MVSGDHEELAVEVPVGEKDSSVPWGIVAKMACIRKGGFLHE